ncbi:MAG: DUF2927 domain-containing protein [Pseudomonadota bacterium]
MKAVLVALLACLAGAAFADSQLVIDRILSDDDFYRAVSCGAPPGGACRLDTVRWPQGLSRDLTISVADTAKGFARRHGRAGEKALAAAIGEINRTGAALHLRRVADGAPAPIQVWFTDIAEGDPIVLPNVSIPQGDRMEGARVYIWWTDANQIDRAVIILSRDLLPEEIRSVMLEELTQSLGFLTDLEGNAYTDTSIFSEFSNAVTGLAGQDRMALRRHYPR